jgi:hypothetical protein
MSKSWRGVLSFEIFWNLTRRGYVSTSQMDGAAVLGTMIKQGH